MHAKCESLWRSIRSFLTCAPPHNASAGASVEKIFDLGKTDTAQNFARVLPNISTQNFLLVRA